MINKKQAKKFCCDDISRIENYDKAVADKTQTWHCHHRAEILPCGRYKMLTLIKFGLYFKRPASELIFMTPHDHISWHSKDNKYGVGVVPWNKGITLGEDYPMKCCIAQKKRSAVEAYLVDGTFIEEFPSIANAAKQLGLNRSNVNQVVLGHKKSTCGYMFKQVN